MPKSGFGAQPAYRGWGSFAQQVSGGESHFVLEVKWGNVPLKTIALRLPKTSDVSAKSDAQVDGVPVACSHALKGDRLLLTFEDTVKLSAGKTLTIRARSMA